MSACGGTDAQMVWGMEMDQPEWIGCRWGDELDDSVAPDDDDVEAVGVTQGTTARRNRAMLTHPY